MVEFKPGDKVVLNRDIVNKLDRYHWVTRLIADYKTKEYVTILKQYEINGIQQQYRTIDSVWYVLNHLGWGGPYPQCFFLPYNNPLSYYSKSGYKNWEAKHGILRCSSR